MPRLFTNSTTPSNDKTCFWNYVDHINFEAQRIEADFKRSPDATYVDMLSRQNIFVPLRDGHDYMDEVMGASVLPLLGVCTVVGGLVMAVYGGLTVLAICSGLAEDSIHADRALGYLLGAGAALVFAVASLIKSVISLFSRPIITATQGWAPQNVDRFRNEDSVQAAMFPV